MSCKTHGLGVTRLCIRCMETMSTILDLYISECRRFGEVKSVLSYC